MNRKISEVNQDNICMKGKLKEMERLALDLERLRQVGEENNRIKA